MSVTEPRTNFPQMRLIAVLGPALYVAALFTLTVVFVDRVPLPLLISIGVLAVATGATAFSAALFQVIERSEDQLRERGRQLAAVQAAATELSSERQLGSLLERFVELSRSITDARYGALAIRRPDGSIEEFITSGISDEERALIGDPPTGHGLLGVNIYEGAAVRIGDIGADARAGGFPPHHPKMHSLLGVPVVSKGRIVGNLYLTDKITASEFTDTDEEMVRLFAAHAATAVESRRLEEKLRFLAILQERERIAMDLHDGIIQAIYAASLKLEGSSQDVASAPDEARSTINVVIENLDEVIRDVRSYILELRPAHPTDDLDASLHTLAEGFQANSLIDTTVIVAADLPVLTEDQRLAVFHIAQEALVNARKHSQASSLALHLGHGGGCVRLEVRDNGRGFDPAAELTEDHRGVRNMTTRAHGVRGTLDIESAPGSGTVIRLELPLVPAIGEHL